MIGWAGVVIGVVLGVVLAINVPVIAPFLEQLLGFQIMPGDVYYVTRIPSELEVRDVTVIAIAAFILTLLTEHKLGVWRVLPHSLHLAVDALVGVVFVVAPFVLGFSGIDAMFYWANGAAVLLVVGLHKPEPATVHAATPQSRNAAAA